MSKVRTSRIAGFYERSLADRLALLERHAGLSQEGRSLLSRGATLTSETADRMSENVIGVHGLPLAVALNFVVNGVERVVPMAIEEPSVVAAASNAAKMIRLSGGFSGEADPPVMTAQIQFDDVADPLAAAAKVRAAEASLLQEGDRAIPRMVARGGGCRGIEVRVLDEELGIVVVDVFVDVADAMGANIADAVAEALAPAIHELMGGSIGLRILSNLPIRRKVRVQALVTSTALGDSALVDGIARASRFAERDPFRAVTHNKGFLNGLDAAAVALGQDWRAIEAGAHAYAAWSGTYRPLATWVKTENGLLGRAELPLAVGTVGGCVAAHPGVRLAFELLGVTDARSLAVVLASVGLASNLAALRALAGEGIQRGHMELHRRKLEPGANREQKIPTTNVIDDNIVHMATTMGGSHE